MRRIFAPLALALTVVSLTVSSAAAQTRPLPPVSPPLPPVGVGASTLRVTGVTEQAGITRILVRNQGLQSAATRAVQLRVYRDGLLIGTLRSTMGSIPAGGSRL